MSTSKSSSSKILAAQIILAVISISAALAGLGALTTVADASNDVLVVETWRMLGFFTFAALFGLLARKPQGNRQLWLIVILNKFALTIAGLIFVSQSATITGASDLVVFDGGVTALLIVSSLLAGVWKNRTSV